MNTKIKTKASAVKAEKSIGEADAAVLKLRKRLVVPKYGTPYLSLRETSGLTRRIPLALVRSMNRFKVLGKTIMAQAEVKTPVTKAKMTLHEAVKKLRSDLGGHTRLSEVLHLLDDKAEITNTVWHPATPAELEEYQKARKALDKALVEAALYLYKDSVKTYHREAEVAFAASREASQKAEKMADQVNFFEGLAKEFK